MIYVVLCMLHFLCFIVDAPCMFYASCYMLCLLSMLHVPCCIVDAPSSMYCVCTVLQDLCSTVYALSSILHDLCSRLHAHCYMFYSLCCILHDPCSIDHVYVGGGFVINGASPSSFSRFLDIKGQQVYLDILFEAFHLTSDI